MTALVNYETAHRALEVCHRFDEVKDIRDKAEAMAAYARQAKDTQMIQWVTEIKVRAERRCGELLRDSPKNKGAAGVGPIAVASSDRNTPTLAEIGITKDESSRYQRLAAMPEEHFETAVAAAKDAAGQVTTAFMLREAKKKIEIEIEAKAEPVAGERKSLAVRVAQIRDLVESGHNTAQIGQELKLSEQHVRNLINTHKMAKPLGFSVRGRAIRIDVVLAETVSTLTGLAQGIQTIKGQRLESLPAEEAKEMLAEMRRALVSINWLMNQLKEQSK